MSLWAYCWGTSAVSSVAVAIWDKELLCSPSGGMEETESKIRVIVSTSASNDACYLSYSFLRKDFWERWSCFLDTGQLPHLMNIYTCSDLYEEKRTASSKSSSLLMYIRVWYLCMWQECKKEHTDGSRDSCCDHEKWLPACLTHHLKVDRRRSYEVIQFIILSSSI